MPRVLLMEAWTSQANGSNFLKEVAPAITRVALLFNPDAAPGRGSYYMRPFEAAAASLAITPMVTPVRNAEEIERVISRLEGQPPSGLVATPDYFVASQRELIILYPASATGAKRGSPSLALDAALVHTS